MGKITKLRKTDAPALARLHKKCFAQGWSAADFEGHIQSSADDVIGFIKDQALCGFIIMRTQFDQSEVLTIAVDSAQRGHGIGAQILKAGEAAATKRGADIVFLEVAKDNTHAIALYKNAAYQPCGVRPGYYKRKARNGRMGGRIDALLFQKQL